MLTSKKDFEKNYFQAYRKARLAGWLKDYTWFKRPMAHNKKYTHEFCKKEINNYKKISDIPYRMIKSIRENDWKDLIEILEKIKKSE